LICSKFTIIRSTETCFLSAEADLEFCLSGPFEGLFETVNFRSSDPPDLPLLGVSGGLPRAGIAADDDAADGAGDLTTSAGPVTGSENTRSALAAGAFLPLSAAF